MVNVTASCRLPCVPNVADDLPGVIPDVVLFTSDQPDPVTDATAVASGGATSGTAGVWTELMPADAARLGASVQNKAVTGSLFILPYATGVPASGTQAGETEVPQAPGYFSFEFEPKKRYVVRGTVASMSYTLTRW